MRRKNFSLLFFVYVLKINLPRMLICSTYFMNTVVVGVFIEVLLQIYDLLP